MSSGFVKQTLKPGRIVLSAPNKEQIESSGLRKTFDAVASRGVVACDKPRILLAAIWMAIWIR
jgi:hypothetical protein